MISKTSQAHCSMQATCAQIRCGSTIRRDLRLIEPRSVLSAVRSVVWDNFKMATRTVPPEAHSTLPPLDDDPLLWRRGSVRVRSSTAYTGTDETKISSPSEWRSSKTMAGSDSQPFFRAGEAEHLVEGRFLKVDGRHPARNHAQTDIIFDEKMLSVCGQVRPVRFCIVMLI